MQQGQTLIQVYNEFSATTNSDTQVQIQQQLQTARNFQTLA